MAETEQWKYLSFEDLSFLDTEEGGSGVGGALPAVLALVKHSNGNIVICFQVDNKALSGFRFLPQLRQDPLQ